MTDYETVMTYLRDEAIKVRGAWNGKESGKLEDRANAATELLELLESVDEIVKELDL